MLAAPAAGPRRPCRRRGRAPRRGPCRPWLRWPTRGAAECGCRRRPRSAGARFLTIGSDCAAGSRRAEQASWLRTSTLRLAVGQVGELLGNFVGDLRRRRRPAARSRGGRRDRRWSSSARVCSSSSRAEQRSAAHRHSKRSLARRGSAAHVSSIGQSTCPAAIEQLAQRRLAEPLVGVRQQRDQLLGRTLSSGRTSPLPASASLRPQCDKSARSPCESRPW